MMTCLVASDDVDFLWHLPPNEDEILRRRHNEPYTSHDISSVFFTKVSYLLRPNASFQRGRR